jgi:hypothetical protein
MTFKKNGRDPALGGVTGWSIFANPLAFIGSAFGLSLAPGMSVNNPSAPLRPLLPETAYRKVKVKSSHRKRRKLHRNMLHVSKRVRRKHRRAA